MTQLRTRTLHEVLAGLLVPMAAALLITHLGGLTHGSGCMVPKAVLLASASKLWRHYHWRGSDFLVTVAGSVLCQKPTGYRYTFPRERLSQPEPLYETLSVRARQQRRSTGRWR
jgi:hypothetical protein